MSSYHLTAFVRAWEAFLAWQESEPPPTINVRGVPLSIDRVCSLLWQCSDKLPNDLAEVLTKRTAPGQPMGNPSYAGGARVLRALYRERLPNGSEQAAETSRSASHGEQTET